MSLASSRAMSSDDSVSYETKFSRQGLKFAVLTLKPADSQHLFRKELVSGFRNAIQLAVKDEVKGLITTHEGDWFSAGFDYQSPQPAELVAAFANLIADFIQLPFPTVAYVKGYAYKAGFTLALIHDYLVLSNNDPTSLCHNELVEKHEVPPYAAALVRDKFQLLPSLELLVSSKCVGPPQFAPISDYVMPYVGWSIDHVVDKLLEPSVGLVGSNYSDVRKILLPQVWEKVNPKPARG